jgi:hypothetical protein
VRAILSIILEYILFFGPAMPGVILCAWLAHHFSWWWLLAMTPAGVLSWILVGTLWVMSGELISGRGWNPFQ